MRPKTSFGALSLWVLAIFGTSTYATPIDKAERAVMRYDNHQFQHPGALHTKEDIQRVKRHVKQHDEPWSQAFKHFEESIHAQTSWKPMPQSFLVCGSNPDMAENYQYAFRDAHSAYQLTIRWLISGNNSYADTAVEILDAWSSALTDIHGNEDMFLGARIYGYQFASAAELLRVYPGWPKSNQKAFGTMLNDIFAKYNRLFLDYHNNKPDFYYANWDLCNIASYMAIGIFNDNKTMYDFAVNYFMHGPSDGAVANGALPFFSIANFTEEGSGKTLMQGQESGRDQAHALFCFGLLGCYWPARI